MEMDKMNKRKLALARASLLALTLAASQGHSQDCSNCSGYGSTVYYYHGSCEDFFSYSYCGLGLPAGTWYCSGTQCSSQSGSM